ncbi:tetratricopeptide repeat protein [Epilithonimonas ginsengisoli]|uniref:Tetratricopeptide repeat protein n=1 Tax=Epilithonimonas ginsengisoli TaxID=1245592 RepID=A0ABU4JJV9_9FLAO|nr:MULTISPECIES: tetratricopeptide repeat protein [Chryseobacterium group]MBV6880876.1 hypothetical protein [Epilithonimonas sp. FP105]MDW8549766.1 tetratricopeptide repeat protein [Epilithonimonas ginsengisoli]OAH66529.1 hypothetical protein AXA65_17560 [Chryseobacterium sp. FP211-J200]
MNTRVLELIKNPKIITESDLSILESESEKMPYAQSIRALYLYGINLYQSKNYKENLSKTAAYTTDKKILFQFINSQKTVQKEETPTHQAQGQIIENQVPNEKTTAEDIIEKTDVSPQEVEDVSVVLNKFDIDRIIKSENQDNSEFIVVEGEKNRLLYEGEENFLEEKSQEIDIEATKESGIITVKDDLESNESMIAHDDNRSEETISEHKNVEEVIETPIEKVSETIVESQAQDEDPSGNVSFNGIEEFLPQVKFSVPKNHLDYLNPPKKEIRKEESPVQEKPVSKTEFKEPIAAEIREEEIDNSQISFGETQSFEVSKPVESEKTETVIENQNEEKVVEDQINFENTQSFEVSEPEKIEETKIQAVNQIAEANTKDQISFENTQTFEVSKPEKNVIETSNQEIENIAIEKEAIVEQPISTWKPMSFSANTPDALIGRLPEVEKPKQEIKIEEKIEKPELTEEIVIEEKPTEVEKIQTKEIERPVMNVSFFGNEAPKIIKEKEIPSILDKPKAEEIPDSNVGTFINTWQSWLKIDRQKSEESPEKTMVVKEKIIDQFIEKNPKISQLKDEVNFVVKEKKDDISHLMTETLAKLYVEQKLYSKAIKAYETLIEKHPQKEDYFKEKIEEVKEIRKS